MRERILKSAHLLKEKRTTVRDIATYVGCSKSTVHKDLSERLKNIDYALYEEIQKIFEINKSEKHLRGGESTRKKYESIHNLKDT